MKQIEKIEQVWKQLDTGNNTYIQQQEDTLKA
jgi:hypothetical protein